MDIDAASETVRLQNRLQHLLIHAAKTAGSFGDPLTYREAMSRPDAKQWELAMREEIKS